MTTFGLRTNSRLSIRVQVADGTITVTVSGRLTEPDLPSVVAELAAAYELCSGVVVLDLRTGTGDPTLVVRAITGAAIRARRTQCGVRVSTADRVTAAALEAAGVAVTAP
ncbi:hypothetical protein [Amycolatopsis sp. PS_44_ISF1]|uniref:hypothetical protein n=1 Tax=Amycolatopsis sp. PS_44_ISF1 TaxID=2974917 RepID=UPI0028DF1D6A|nr:hypothetical protein [Amycolatopsis sp. PS_44_ISF1]MDT8914722.1 hypothetical protein [Amycolatopsis sp. PS_44_ISF1]